MPYHSTATTLTASFAFDADMIVAGKLAAEATALGVPTCGGVRPKKEYSPAEMKVKSH